jgi:hypothetical protein
MDFPLTAHPIKKTATARCWIASTGLDLDHDDRHRTTKPHLPRSETQQTTNIGPKQTPFKKKKLMANGNHQEDQNSAEDKTFRKIPRITVG